MRSHMYVACDMVLPPMVAPSPVGKKRACPRSTDVMGEGFQLMMMSTSWPILASSPEVCPRRELSSHTSCLLPLNERDGSPNLKSQCKGTLGCLGQYRNV